MLDRVHRNIIAIDVYFMAWSIQMCHGVWSCLGTHMCAARLVGHAGLFLMYVRLDCALQLYLYANTCSNAKYILSIQVANISDIWTPVLGGPLH